MDASVWREVVVSQHGFQHFDRYRGEAVDTRWWWFCVKSGERNIRETFHSATDQTHVFSNISRDYVNLEFPFFVEPRFVSVLSVMVLLIVIST